MKTSTILLSVALAFRTIYSKAVYYHSKAISEQLSIPEEDSSFELVESRNFIYKLHCSEEKKYCDKIKKDLYFAFSAVSNAFGKQRIFIYFINYSSPINKIYYINYLIT